MTGVEQDNYGVTERIAGPTGEETIRTRYLVGASGGRSFARRTRCGFLGKTLRVRALVADVTLTGWDMTRGNSSTMVTWSLVAICPLAGTDLQV